jgi:hypothetical protein
MRPSIEKPSYAPSRWSMRFPWNRWLASKPSRLLIYWPMVLAVSVVLIVVGFSMWFPLGVGGIVGVIGTAWELGRYGPKAWAAWRRERAGHR